MVVDIMPSEDGPASEDIMRRLQGLLSTQAGRAQLDNFDLLPMLGAGIDDVHAFSTIEDVGVEIVSGSAMRATATTDGQLRAGGSLSAHAGDEVEIVAAALDLRTLGSASAHTGDAQISAQGRLDATVSGAVDLSAETADLVLADALTASVGANASLQSAGDVSLLASGGGSVRLGGNLSAGAASVDISASERLSAVARVVQVDARDGVTVASTGATVQVSGETEMEYVGFTWRSSGSFDQYENVVPNIERAEEFIIRSLDSTQVPAVKSVAGTSIAINIGANGGAAGTAWTRVWDTQLGTGVYTLDGMRVRWGAPTDVTAVQLTSTGGNTPTFDGCGEMYFLFGRTRVTGSIKMHSAGAMMAVADELIQADSARVSVLAKDMLEAHSGGSIKLTGESLDVGTTGNISATTESLELQVMGDTHVYGGGELSADVDSATAHVRSDAQLEVAGSLELLSDTASLHAAGQLDVESESAQMRVEDRLLAYAGEGASLITTQADIQVGGTLQAMAGEGASLDTGSGGLAASTLGGAAVRTPEHQLELPVGGDGSLRSLHGLELNSEHLTANANRVKISAKGGGGGEADQARVSFGMQCSDDGEDEDMIDCDTLEAAIANGNVREVLAEHLGVPVSRLRMGA